MSNRRLYIMGPNRVSLINSVDQHLFGTYYVSGASLIAQLLKNPPAMQETWVRFLGWEDPLEKGKATHSSILACSIHGLYSLWGRKESDRTDRLSLSLI